MDDNATRAARASRFLRNQLRFGSATAMIVVFAFGSFTTRYVQDGVLAPSEKLKEEFASTSLIEFWNATTILYLVCATLTFVILCFVWYERPQYLAYVWMFALNLYGAFALTVTTIASAEQAHSVIEKFATDPSAYYGLWISMSFWGAGTYSQPLTLRTRFMTVAGHIALRSLQGPILYTRVGPQWGLKWLRFCWMPIVSSLLGGYFAAALFWRSRASRAVACAAHADSLDERYVEKSARRIKLPNAMLESMVENLKAEVYEMRLRLMSRSGVGESDSSGGDTYREEELHEGDIRGSFAEGA